MLHACYLLFILCLCMSVKSSTELMLYVVLTMPTLNKAYLFIYLFSTSEYNVSEWSTTFPKGIFSGCGGWGNHIHE